MLTDKSSDGVLAVGLFNGNRLYDLRIISTKGATLMFDIPYDWEKQSGTVIKCMFLKSCESLAPIIIKSIPWQ